MSPRFPLNAEEILLRGNDRLRAEESENFRGVVAGKIEDLRHYDIPGMDRVVAICCSGSSGSLLLASYLDGHEDVVMLPELCGTHIYLFFDLYQSLPLRDKLIAYPISEPRFFEGNFAISPPQYYAAVQAIFQVYGDSPTEFLSSRRAFFLFLHVAYSLALGIRPASPNPLMVYAQHAWDNGLARRLVDDFPQAKFIHTVRDPIALYDRMFNGWLHEAEELLVGEQLGDSGEVVPSVPSPSTSATPRLVAAFRKFMDLFRRRRFGALSAINRDRPHSGMESRTLAIRFEDLHCDLAETMRDLCDWLGLAYRTRLLDSTFNGVPYVVTREGKTWSGLRPAQAQRNPRHVSRKDRALLFALFHENFVAWNYSCPRIFGNRVVRYVVFASLLLVPMKMEIAVAQSVFKRRVLPSLRNGNTSMAMKFLYRTAYSRMAIILLFGLEFFGRRAYGKTLLDVGYRRRAGPM